MTTLEEHKKRILEHLEEIDDAINQGIEKKPVTLGFHCSACAIELLEFYLHKANKIPIGKILKHDWFKKPTPEQKKEALIDRKLPVTFERKEEIYNIIYEIEEKRNSLVYGSPTKEKIKEVLENFQKLKEIFNDTLKDEIQL
jgi:hypothetical protein